MAHAKKNTIAGNLRGALGKELVFRNWDGETVVSKYPRRKRKPTPRQTAMRGKFHLGTRYAKTIREDRLVDGLVGYWELLLLKP